MLDAGVDIGTGGNHTFSKPEGEAVLADDTFPLVRPYNFGPQASGQGMRTFTIRGNRVTVINLLGEHGMFPAPVDSPFLTMTRLLAAGLPEADATIVDMHSDTTSEHINMGWYLDGKVTAVLGTHTHVATADERVLPEGTGYITDVGMVGLRDSSLGVDRHQALQRFLEGGKAPFEIPDTGVVELRAVILDIEHKKTISIERITRVIDIE
jgi:metallophosphoesterase (TIGR00282 family)